MNINNSKGFSLMEIILAVFIIGITSSAAFIVTTMSIRSQVVGNDYSVAVNLAREGIEVVRGVRDTNWLYYSGSKRDSNGNASRDHWNDSFDGVDGFGNDYNDLAVNIGNRLTDGSDYSIDQVTNYFIPMINYSTADINEKYRWQLKFVATTIGTELYSIDDIYRIYKLSDADGGLFVQDDTLAGTPPVGGTATKYYRLLEIRYQESYDQGGNCEPVKTASPADEDSLADEDPPGDYDGDGDDNDDGDAFIDEDGFHGDCDLNANDNVVLVRSRVMWYDYEGNKLHVELDTVLTDWFRREDHN